MGVAVCPYFAIQGDVILIQGRGDSPVGPLFARVVLGIRVSTYIDVIGTDEVVVILPVGNYTEESYINGGILFLVVGAILW